MQLIKFYLVNYTRTTREQVTGKTKILPLLVIYYSIQAHGAVLRAHTYDTYADKVACPIMYELLLVSPVRKCKHRR